MTAPTARLIMLTAAALAGTATGRPQLQHCDMLSDYEKSVLAQFFPAAAAGPSDSAPEPTVLDYEGSVSPRSSRSNADEKTDFAAVDPLLQSAASPAQGRNYYFGYMERAPAARSTGPPHACGETAEAVARPRAINETAVLPSAAAFEKLTAYYEQLKAQQEMLARQQFQQQLYEQQQRRQQQFVLMQQQIRQQYYQQQEHAMMMFDRLRKNPDFVKQLAAFVDQKRGEAMPDKTGGNEAQTAAAAAPGVPEARAASAPRAADKKKSGEMGPQQTVAADRADEELAAGDAFAAVKRVEARRAEQPGARSEDEQAEDEDEPPVLKKAYSPVFE